MIRAEFSRRTMLDAFARCNGHCEGCGIKLQTGKIEYDHRITCEQGGDNDLTNCQVLCVPCHRDKTRLDVTVIAKSRAVRARHIGAHKAKSPIKGWRKFDGTPVRNPALRGGGTGR